MFARRIRNGLKRISLKRKRSDGSCESSNSFGSSSREDEALRISRTVALGAGCFYGTEQLIREIFQHRYPGAIKNAKVGFMSPYETGVIKNPTYDQVCSGRSGHVQVLFIELRNPEEHFEQLIRLYFQLHDPTTRFKQGYYVGFQYSSWVFCGDEHQRQIVRRVRDELQNLLDEGDSGIQFEEEKVLTCITLMREFTPAPDEHQRYIDKHPGLADVCCERRLWFDPWPQNHRVATSERELGSNRKYSLSFRSIKTV